MPRTPRTETLPYADVVLIGGGIMSATLGSMLAVLEPSWRIVVLEKSVDLASESSDPWNNAGTGHSGFCELNYMPDPNDGTKPAAIARQFQLSRQWWSHLAEAGLVDPATFIHRTAHMNLVFSDRDVAYLRRRVDTLRTDPLFADMEYSEDAEEIAAWAPLTMEGRGPDGSVAASRVRRGTDVDFGALTRALTSVITAEGGGEVLTGHTVTGLSRDGDGWMVTGTIGETPATGGSRFAIRAGTVFVGAGGFALRLLQKARVPEVKGYAVLPVGAAFYRCSVPAVVRRHNAKVYGQADVGAPPMSVPHLDKRVVDDEEHLLFGPFATFSTKLLKHGRLSDFFTTLRPDNLHVVAAAGLQNLSLVRYLIGELAASPAKKFAQLRKYYPNARPNEWELIPAGQRAQLVTPDPHRIGVLQQGTELVVSADGSIAGLLGASPGASTAVPIMVDLLRRSFPAQWRRSWEERMIDAVPDLARQDWSVEAVAASEVRTDRALGLGRDEASAAGESEAFSRVPARPSSVPRL
ncbi:MULTISPECIES: malate dehydrogenase (quinone) [Brevibacterium]|uniref:Probable malate:quinone oxidoreductase n=1 Tax=Brevibacterium casei TaxID=33889 RepID=A0AB34XQZ8_9MICO|nr:malate dehydrogenase (quinone) [Brevibacterium casei]KZE18445.1 malate:quinone oxidoreductase [Brevibacterium casei]NJE66265.1 malate dehydrogenase (quinone) [Brevibacterium sp. LS14]QZE26719.1 malate dehydrogenase (quinone) [Brevibacterium casei]